TGSASSKQIRLRTFIYESIRDHPAEHYMLVLSGHAKGAVGGFLSGESPATSSGLSLLELRQIFGDVRQQFENDGTKGFCGNEKIDILGLDTCLGSMAEIAYELRHNVNIMVATEAMTPISGWPYDRLLEALFGVEKHSTASAMNAARNTATPLADL